MDFETNPCVRCGKERIKKSEKTTLVNASTIKSVLYVCPDKECQKKLEEEIAVKVARRLSFVNRRASFFKKAPSKEK